MNLIIDSGNTQTKLAVFDGETLVKTIVVASLDKDLLVNLLKKFSIKRAIVSNVAAEFDALITFLREKLTLLTFTSEGFNLPFENLYHTPATLGTDRMANASGAIQLFPNENCLVIDVGTCLKFDFVNKAGQYLGGSISLGLNMRVKAMNSFTARLPLIEINEWPLNYIGTSTATSMSAGVAYGMLSEIEGMIKRYEQNYPLLKVILTGGDGQFFVTALKNSIFAHPELTLRGLNKILTINA